MIGHGAWMVTEPVGIGLATLTVLLLAVAATAAVLQSGRAPRPAPVPVDAGLAGDVEAALFARYARGEIDAEEYCDLLARAGGEYR